MRDETKYPDSRGPPTPRRRIGAAWRGLRCWLRNYTFAPLWLPERWRHPVVGYVAGVVLAAAAVGCDLLILNFAPSFGMSGLLPLVAILLAALAWGAGPSLVATLASVAFLDNLDLTPRLVVARQIATLLADDLMLLVVGGIISAIALQVQRARHRAEALRAESEKAADRWRVLQFINDVGLTPQPLDDLLQALLDRTCEALSIENCAILLVDETGQALRIRAVRGLEADLVQLTRIPLGRGASGRVAVTRQTLLIPDLSAIDIVYDYFRERFRSFVGTPLLVDGQLIGVVHMTSAQRDHFTQDDARLLELLASRIALVIDHARLDEAERRAHAEADARASQSEAIFEAMADGLVVCDAERRLLRLNTAARRMIGPEVAEAVFEKRSLAALRARLALRDEHGQLIPDEQLPMESALRGEVLTDGRSQEMLMQTADGEEMIVNASAAPVRDVEGQIVGAVSIFRDVTERRRLVHRIQEALNGLLAIGQTLMQAPDEAAPAAGQLPTAYPNARRLADLAAQILACERLGIFSFDPETEVLDPVAVAGLDPDLGEPWQFKEISRYAEFYAGLLEGKPQVWETTRPPLSEQPNVYRIRTVLIVPMRLHERLVGALFLDYGAAEHTYTAEELSLAEGLALLVALVLERERLLYEREEAQASALASQEAYRQIDAFLGMASHELRTPLTSVLLGLQLSQRRYERLLREDVDVSRPLFQKLRFLFDQLLLTERQARRLDRLVNDLLDVSRIQTGKLVMHRQMADLAAVVAETVQEQRQAAPERRIYLHLPPEGRVPLSIDADRISQVVTNYLTNALKYSGEDQPIEVGLEVAADTARVWVRDYGPGLLLAEQARIWERFHRVPGVMVRSGSGVGLGLGLHISRTIVEAHQGQVGVQSAPGAGATFWFTLPLSPPDSQQATG